MSPGSSRAALIRDAALDRVRRTRRWVLLATAALTAGFAALVSAVAPGRSLASKTSASTAASSATASASTASSSGSAIPSMPPPAGANQLGLSGPNEAPSSGDDQSQSSQPSAPAQPQSAPAPAPAPQPAAPAVVSGGS